MISRDDVSIFGALVRHWSGKEIPMRTNLFLIANLLLTSAAVHAADNPADRTMDARAAFARLKGLVGEWQADTSRGKVHLTYELIAGGTSLVERESGENVPAM